MAGRHNWKKIVDAMTPERRARIERGAQEDVAEMLLSEIRGLAGLTQQQLAESIGIRQPTLSQLESNDDMQISTLRRIVEALGGELEIVANLPSGRISLTQFGKAERTAARGS